MKKVVSKITALLVCALLGGAFATELRAAGGLAFDGVNDYVTFGPATNTLGLSNFTLEVWFNWNGTGATTTSGSGGVGQAIPLIAKGRGESDGNNRDCNYFFAIDASTGTLAADFEDAVSGGNHPIRGTTVILPGEWRHAAATYDGSTWNLYLDGMLEASLYVGATPRWDSIQHASLGSALTSQGTAAGFFSGVLDEVRIWNYARTTQQITNDLYREIPTAPGLVGRWALDETSGTTAADSSGGGTTGTLMNEPLWTTGFPFPVPDQLGVTITNLSKYTRLVMPPAVTLQAATTGAGITRVEFYAGTNKLGEDLTSPYELAWNSPAAGIYPLTAQAWVGASQSVTSAPVYVVIVSAASEWLAYNDYVAGAGTHSNATTWAPFSDAHLKDIFAGTNLPVRVITDQLNASTGIAGAPNPGTPAHNWFSGFVELAGTTLLTPTNGQVTYNFYGLDPARRYTFKATGGRSDARYTNRWIVATLEGAVTFAAAHTPGVLTAAQVPGSLAANQAALNTGVNLAGDVVVWENISPGPDGMFNLRVTQYTGAVPGGTTAGAPYGYGFAAYSLEQVLAIPIINLTAPANNAVVSARSNLVITAAATAPDGVSNVLFYAGAQRLGSDALSPYSVTWTNPPLGQQTLTAVMVDNFGVQATSAPVSITVVTNLPPQVALTSPAAGAVLSGPGNFALAASATDADGAVVGVEFYANGGLVGVDTIAPFQVTWTNTAFGGFALTAVALDDVGSRATSAVVNVTVISNRAPTVVITTPTNYAVFAPGTSIAISVTASDNDGTVANLRLYGDGVLLTSVNASSLVYGWNNVATGIHSLWAVATDNYGASNSPAPIQIIVSPPVGSQWVAYNDHYAGATTHPYATAWNALGTLSGAPGNSGYLRNIVSGTNLPVTLTITNYNMTYGYTAGAPAAGTPAALLFGGYVDFGTGGSVNDSLMVPPGAVVAHVFTGLNPNRRYHFAGTAVRGNAAYTTRYALFELSGAASFVSAHTAGAVTSAQVPGSLATNQVAINTGYNTAGDLCAWHNIDPGADGAITVYSRHYAGALPGGGQADPVSHAYALTAVRLEEVASGLLAAITSPVDGAVYDAPANIPITALAYPASGVTNVAFYADNLRLGTVSASPFTFTWTNAFAGTNRLTVVAADTAGNRATSAVVRVVVRGSLTNTEPPVIAEISPVPGALVGGLTTVVVTFSEPVTGVDAGDLFANLQPANSVSGGPVQYVFTFGALPEGPVTMSWAINHEIRDVGTPALDFSGATGWFYTVVDQIAPTVVAKSPAPGSSVTNLIQTQVTFSEPVTGVDAGDLLVNGEPAFRVSGGGADYTFWFAQPAAPAAVRFAWAENHGIADPAGNPFDHTAASATWQLVQLLPVTTLVPTNAVYRYFRGFGEPSNPITEWRQDDYDDSAWDVGVAPFYYENNPGSGTAYSGNTVLPDMYGGYTCVYLRHSFTVADPGVLTNVFLRLRDDDGYVVYLNTYIAGRHNVAAGDLPYTYTPSGSVSEPPTNNYHLVPLSYLWPGPNVLAIQAFNDNATSSDFLLDAELLAYVRDPNAMPPYLSSLSPAPGEVYAFTNLTVVFSRPVTNVDAADLLVNGVPATSVSRTNNAYTFRFAAPAFGPVTVTWRQNHGVQDLGAPAQPFVPAAAYRYTYLNPNAPVVASQSPVAGATVLNTLTQIQVNFSKAVAGVDAADLLVNGVPATSVSGSGAAYTFTFAQPAYGAVQISWASDPGITEAGAPANRFDPSRTGNAWQYLLVDRAGPVVVGQNPSAGATVTNLTQIQVMFDEPVTGVDAGDLLINGAPATNLFSSGNTCTFFFAPPNGTVIQVTWAAAHGLSDQATPPNPFNAQAPGATWSYFGYDVVPPGVAAITPFPGAAVCALGEVSVTFTEPVTGVSADDLLLNGVAAVAVAGSGAGPYRFSFNPPATGAVAVAWSAIHDIRDLASPPNSFAGSGWNYTFNPGASYVGQVVINEIMYHPASENPAEEYIELHNPSAAAVNLTGWQLTRGVDYTFGALTLPAGGYVVVAADVAAFRAKYPLVTNVVGNWTGRLNNSDEEIRLRDACGQIVDEVRYSDEGEWAIRQRGPYDRGYYGWEWYAEHDGTALDTYSGVTGGNKSLELVNPALPRRFGQNWQASGPSGGTPGQPNSARSTNAAPVITEVEHFPAVPRSTQPVTIRARVADEDPARMSVMVYYRDHTGTSPLGWSSTPMADDGQHNDGLEKDGLYGALLPAMPNGAVVEFYVYASDAQSQSRTWPAAARQLSGTSPQYAQTANALYQVDEDLAPASAANTNQPFYRLIVTGTEYQEFQNLQANAYNSDAMMNATWITSDGDGVKVRYNVGLRIRGAGSRSRPVKNWRVNIPSDRRWNGLTEVNLNAQHIDLQLIGANLSAQAGLPAAEGRAVQVRLNGVNAAQSVAPSSSRGDGYGSYVYIEVLNGDWAARLLPNNSGGNVYRGSKYPWNANLDYLGANPQTYVTAGYSKTSNQSENDWSDLFALTMALNTNLPNAQYAAAVRQHANVELFMRYFALCNYLNYNESSMCNGVGDDYAMYRGVADPRFILLPHDFDTILGLGDGDRMPDPSVSIWRMVDSPRSGDPTQRANYLQRFMRHPEFAPIYLREQYRLATGLLSPAQFDPLVDELLGGWADPARIAQMKSFMAGRQAFVLSQIPRVNTLTIPLGQSQGYYLAGGNSVTLTGRANALEVRSILANGVAASYSVWEGLWTNTVPLQPGLNNILVQWLNETGGELLRSNVVIWFNNGGGSTVSGSLASDTVWTAAAGPYLVASDLTVPAGTTLTIQPGTTVYFGGGARLIVNGRLLAEGTDTQRIRFTRAPGATATWGGIDINGGVGSPETRIAYAHFEFNGSTAIHSTGGTVFLDHLTFSATGVQYVSLDGSSFVVQYCHFPATTAAFEPAHGSGGIKAGGRGIFYRNFFGPVMGYSDTIDFTGGNRPGPILQVIENVFMGSGDDILDLDGTDAHIEGNLFAHIHKNGSPDSASAVSGGRNGSDTSEVTMARNIFYDCDQAAMAKEGNFFKLINNTIVHQTRLGGTDADAAVVCLADEGTAEGLGMYLEGNVVFDAEKLARNVGSATVTYTNNLLPLSWSGPGGGNVVMNPQFKYVPSLAETYFTSWEQAQVMWDWFSLRPDSPAKGAGPNGLDFGAVVPGGPSLRPVPGWISESNLTLTVGGPGIEAYRYRLNGGEFPANEYPVAQPIQLSNLAPGAYMLEVMGKDSGGVWRSNELAARAWTLTPDAVNVILSEVLAANREAFVHHGTTPDCIELYNAGLAPVDLGGLRLSDDPTNPDKFVFPPNTLLSNGAYLVVFADTPNGTPGFHLGFNLAQEGEGVFLHDSLARGGRRLDAVEFGPQLNDYSIARLAGGAWELAQPTLGGPNRGTTLGDARALRINEWLARSASAADFIELHNSSALPVALGGLYLTDNAVGWPDRHPIPPLSFVPALGYTVFLADGDPAQGPLHLNFQLRAEQGQIALVNTNLSVIDAVVYPPQSADVAQGRFPDGAAAIVRFDRPTPGAGNPLAGVAPEIRTVTLINFTDAWRYEQSGADLGTAWREAAYNDSAWPGGNGLLARPLAGTTQYAGYAVNTPLTTSTTKTTFYFRVSFALPPVGSVLGLQLQHIIDDGAVFYLNGQELTRFNLPSNTVSYTTLANSSLGDPTLLGPYSLPASALRPGTNVLAVEVHQGVMTSSDIVFGLQLDALVVTNAVGLSAVVLNEIMTDNQSHPNADGSVTDWIELYNRSAGTVDLSDASLSDNELNPRRWVFPAGVTIGPFGYLRVLCDGNRPASTNAGGLLNTGFGLKNSGGGVYLFDTAANLSSNLQAVVFGVQAADYTIGRVPNGSGGWTLALPTPEQPNLAAALGAPTALRVNEWMPRPASGDDWFELYNAGNQPVALAGLHLTDNLGNPTKHPLPALSFIGANTNGYRKFIADSNPAAGADHVGFKLDNAQEQIGVADAEGNLIHGIAYISPETGVSEGCFPDGSTNIVRFPDSASPGDSNYRRLTEVVINEALSNSENPFEDAIELRNTTTNAINIGGWWLSDSRSVLRKFRIPDETLLPPLGYVVFYEYQFNPNPEDAASFALSSWGDAIQLSAADANGLTGYRTSVDFGAAAQGVSFGRYVTSTGEEEFVPLSARTFGRDHPADTNEFRLGTGAANAEPLIGDVVISEILFQPPDLGTNDNTRDEYIELRNHTSVPQPLFDPLRPTNTWRLRNAVDFDFPALTLPPNGTLLVVGFDPVNDPETAAAFRAAHRLGAGVLLAGPWSGRLANDTEAIELKRPGPPDTNGVPYYLVEKIRYADRAPWPLVPAGSGLALQRVNLAGYGNDPTNWFAAAPTPGFRVGEDADGDGLPDDWEHTHGLAPNNPADAALDSDGDGMSNLAEYLAGTDPTDPRSALRFETVAGQTASNVLSLSFTAPANRSYTIQRRDSLTAGVWEKYLDLEAAATNRLIGIEIPIDRTNRFYRLLTPKQ